MYGQELVLPGMPAASSMKPMPVRENVVESSAYREQFHNRLNAHYESARTTIENERYWAGADYLSPNASNSFEVRRQLRSRARYEIANDSYASGMLETLAADIVGSGPRINIRDREIEVAWLRWSSAIGLGAKLRTGVKQKKGNDGEAIYVLFNNPALTTPAQLDIRQFEADQMTTPGRLEVEENRRTDGIDYDQYGNPTQYYFLKSHPGGNTWDIDWPSTPVAARNVMHWYRVDRPGQHRGIPELTPALSLFAQRRRFTIATIAAAETAASYSAVMYTDQPAEAVQLDQEYWWDAIPIEYRAMLTLPDGWSMRQFTAEHPTTTFPDFTRALVTEMARCWSMPRNIASGDSAQMTYSSGQLDHLIYWQAITVERAHLTEVVLENLFEAWLREHLSAQSGIRQQDIDLNQPEYEHQWIWPVRPSRDPLKDSQAAVTLFDRGLMVDEQWWIEQGFDPQRMREMLKDSIEQREEIGAPVPGVAVTNTTSGSDEPADETSEEAA